jgi:hypothetical protein
MLTLHLRPRRRFCVAKRTRGSIFQNCTLGQAREAQDSLACLIWSIGRLWEKRKFHYGATAFRRLNLPVGSREYNLEFKMVHRGRKNVFDLMPVTGEPAGTAARPAWKPAEPPGHLSDAIKAWWRQVVTEYDLEAHELLVLQAAAEAWDRCEEARLAIAEHGLTYEGPHGPRPRPEVAIERDARIAFARLVRELNLELPPAYNEIGHRTR